MQDNIFKNVQGTILVNVHELLIYIPKVYFELEISEMKGSILSTIGIFKFGVKFTEGGEDNYFVLNTPNTIDIPYEEYYETKTMLKDDIEETAYFVFVLHSGDVFLQSEEIISSVKNVEKFINLLHSGHLPKISYSALYKQYQQVQQDNGIVFDVPSSMLEGSIAEIARSSKNIRVPLRMVKGATGKPEEFVLINIKALPRLTNTFAGLSFEDINTSLVSSISRKRSGQGDTNTSPMEEILYY